MHDARRTPPPQPSRGVTMNAAGMRFRVPPRTAFEAKGPTYPFAADGPGFEPSGRDGIASRALSKTDDVGRSALRKQLTHD